MSTQGWNNKGFHLNHNIHCIESCIDDIYAVIVWMLSTDAHNKAYENTTHL